MISRVNTVKAFLYFGGVFVILLGGAIVLQAPYNYMGLAAGEGHVSSFSMLDRPGYYPQFEVAVDMNAENASSDVLHVDFLITNNATFETTVVNLTLDEADKIENSNPPKYVNRKTVDLEPGNYTILVARVEGASVIDLGYKQVSDSRLFIVIGGSLNIAGLVMSIVGYCISGSLIGSGDEAIVDWGYEEETAEQQT